MNSPLTGKCFVSFWRKMIMLWRGMIVLYGVLFQHGLTVSACTRLAADGGERGSLFQQLLGVTDLVLDGYRWQLEASQADEELRQHYEHDRTQLIAPFCKSVTSGIMFLRFLAATKQLYKWYFPSVCLSVRPSVRPSVTPFSPCSHHRIIMKFSGVITMVKSDVHAKGQGQRSKVKVTEVNTQLCRFRTLTPVWIHIWQWNHAHNWKQHRRGALLFFKVIRQISRSHGTKNRWIWPRLGVSGL